MSDDALATPWSAAPLSDLSVLAVLPEQRRSPRVPGGPWGDRPLPVPVPAWWLREQRAAEEEPASGR